MFSERTADSGYTLLELLVATAIMAIATVPLTWGFKLGVGTWRDVHRQTSERERIYLVRERLQNWLGAAYPLDVNRKPGAPLYPLVGEEKSVSFSAPIHPDPTKNELYRVELRLSAESVLQMAMIPDTQALDFPTEVEWYNLVQDVSSLNLAYLDSVTPAGELVWLSSWQERYYLPRAVRVSVEFHDSSLSWPDMIVTPQLEEWAFCGFDAVSRNCRTGEVPG